MSIIRVGLAETDGFSDGYDRIFGKKADDKADQPKKPEEKKDDTQQQTPPAK